MSETKLIRGEPIYEEGFYGFLPYYPWRCEVWRGERADLRSELFAVAYGKSETEARGKANSIVAAAAIVASIVAAAAIVTSL